MIDDDYTKKIVPEGSYVSTKSGWRMHYHDIGEGFPLIMLHGSAPGASAWSNFKSNYKHFVDQGFRVLLLDSLGFGYSDKPTDEDYCMAFLNRGLSEFLDALNIDKCLIIGNSLGGAQAIRLAIDEPERVSGLVALGPGALGEWSIYAEMPGIKAMLDAPFDPQGITRERLKNVFKLQLFDPSNITDELIEERYVIAVRQPQHVFSSFQLSNQVDELSKVSCPVYAFWGTSDNFCPISTHTELLKHIPDVKVSILSRCGHWAQFEHSKFFNESSAGFLRQCLG